MKTRNAFVAASLCGLFIISGLHPCLAQRGSAGYLPQLYMGQHALKARKWSSAASHFRQVLVWDSKGAEALSGLGYVYLGTSERDRALESFRAALKINPHLAEAEGGVHLAIAPGKAEAVFDALTEQAQQEPDNADVHAMRAQELVKRNRLDEARKEAQRALKLNPKQENAYCALGCIALKQGRNEEAHLALMKAIKCDASDDDAYTALGDAAMKTKIYASAAQYNRRVTQIVPYETEGHHKLMEALTAAGDLKGAEREERTLARLNAR